MVPADTKARRRAGTIVTSGDGPTDLARSAGYTRIRLWTNSVLSAARHLYQRAGYRLVASEPHHSFGHDLEGETWELEL